MRGALARIGAWGRQPLNLLWVAAAALVILAFGGRWTASDESPPLPTDILILSVAEVQQLGGGTIPRWSQLSDAYGLSDSQMERSACLTEGLTDCDRDFTREGQAIAHPKAGRLILSLSNR